MRTTSFVVEVDRATRSRSSRAESPNAGVRPMRRGDDDRGDRAGDRARPRGARDRADDEPGDHERGERGARLRLRILLADHVALDAHDAAEHAGERH